MTPVQRTLAVTVAVIGTALGLGLVGQAWSVREDVQTKAHTLERELDEKRSIAANHAQMSAQLSEMREMLGVLVQQLPSRFDRPAMEKALHDQATLAGIDIVSLRMDKEIGHEGFYAEVSAQIVAQGSTAQFLKFMDALQQQMALRQVSALKIEAVDGRTLQAALTLDYFRYIEYQE